jgi:hypothetical protein
MKLQQAAKIAANAIERVQTLEQRHQQRLEQADEAVLAGNADFADFKLMVANDPGFWPYIEDGRPTSLDDSVPADIIGTWREPFHAYWHVIGRTPDDIPRPIHQAFTPVYYSRYRSDEDVYRRYLTVNVVLVYIDRWERANDPHHSGQKWSRVDILRRPRPR